MRIYLTCLRCLQDGRAPPFKSIVRPLVDSGVYAVTCAHGHETHVISQQMKFEILFDLGVYALIDEYPREAVSSFAAALERFYEFYLQVQCDRGGVDSAAFESTWKRIAAQSERQFGAFTFVHLLEEKAPPPALSDWAVKFRNGVIHKGTIPESEDAIRFGEEAASIILQVLSRLRAVDEAAVHRAVGRHVRELSQRASAPNRQGMDFGTMISISRATSQKQPTLREWIDAIRVQRDMLVQWAATNG